MLEGSTDVGQLRAGCLFTESSDEEVRRSVSAVRAGKSLKPDMWPGGARVAVAITFDVDHEFPVYRSEAAILSIGEYGATTAMPRILEMLKRQQIRSTFFVPGMVQVIHPDTVPQILATGEHEVGLHGWVHERAPDLRDRKEEAALLERSINVLTAAAGGVRPVGHRAPNNAISEHTLGLLAEQGIHYDSSLSARDDPHEILLSGEVANIIELPLSWEAGDYLYFHHDEFWRGSMPLPEAILDVWKSDFDVAYAEGTMFNLTLHPQVIGRRSRFVVLERLIEYIKSRGDVWFATLGEIAECSKPRA
jgi:peptidoglycan-N-acetylglucosamine deacetylase